jgi:uncharacterized membrane protein YbaN (DUF454 family)
MRYNRYEMRYLVAGLGFISLAVGIVGIVIPILPSFPLFLLAGFCFARSSQKFHHWFIKSRLYRDNLQSLVERREMTRRAKVRAIAVLTVVMGTAFYFMESVPVARGLIVLVWLAHIYFFVFRIKTIN